MIGLDVTFAGQKLCLLVNLTDCWKMAYTKRQIVTAISILLLAVLTALGAYASHLIQAYSLPIPLLLSALTTALPAIAGLSIEGLTRLNRRELALADGKPSPYRGSFFNIVVNILFVIETVLATLSGTHVAPTGDLTCGLNTEWLRLFRAKDADTIQRIQNVFNCCGLHSVADMAYPFPAKGVPADTCATRYDRSSSCFEAWKGQEQKAASFMLAVIIVVVIWKVSFLY